MCKSVFVSSTAAFLNMRQQSAPVNLVPLTTKSVRLPNASICSALRKGSSKECSHSQQKVSWSGADVKYAPRSSVTGHIMGNQLIVAKEDLTIAQGVVKDAPRPGDPLWMKPLHELSPTIAHSVEPNARHQRRGRQPASGCRRINLFGLPEQPSLHSARNHQRLPGDVARKCV